MSGDSGSGRPVPRESEDVALVLAIVRTRDRVAFGTLFSRYAPRLKSWLLRGGVDPRQAEDLVQETMLSVWRKADSFDPCRAGVATWIFTIARNQRIDARRRASSRRLLDEDDPSLAPFALAMPDAAYGQLERETQLRAALTALPQEQIEVIRLSFFEDRPHAEIERVLGIPLGTVKSRLRLAMNRLRAVLADDTPSRQQRHGEPP
jgi:RNA polymerase sigma-70 factor (ECF subfamily)